jgi:chromosome partitioning protein
MVNRKTGVGKTTLTLALADFLSAVHNRSVLVIDMDPQATASLLLLGEENWKVLEDTKATIADLFEHAIRRPGPSVPFDVELLSHPVQRVYGARGQLHVIASSPRLQGIEESAMEALASWSLYAGSPYVLLHQPGFIEMMNTYDYVLIDCPTSLGLITLNALTISSGYLIPTTSDYIATVALTQMTERVKLHAAGLRRKIPLYGTVATRFNRAELRHAFMLDDLGERPEVQPLWETFIPDLPKAAENLHQTEGLMTLNRRYGNRPHSLYPYFDALASEFLQRVS